MADKKDADAQLNAALQEAKALRKTAAALAGQAQNLEQRLTAAAPETAAAIDYAISQSPPPAALSDWIQAGNGAADWSSLTGQDLPTAVMQGRKAERLLAEIIRVYSQFSEVRGIAVGQYLDEIRVFVLLDLEQYDTELIGRLIKKEWGLGRQFQPLCLSLHYSFVGAGDLEPYLYLNQPVVWLRDSE